VRVSRAFPVALAAVAACGPPTPEGDPIFIDGRAVGVNGDSLLAMTRSGVPAVVIRNRYTGSLDTIGLGTLREPLQAQGTGERWYVMDVDPRGRPTVRIFSRAGAPEGGITLDSAAGAPQFAVLPDGRVIVEGTAGRLLAIRGDSVSTFAETPGGPKPGLLIAAEGGVLHALPDRSITLYNAFGNPRWRVEWPWREDAWVSGMAVDRNGRMHFISGTPADSSFRIYTFSGATGEVLRWSEPGPSATFVVDHLGEAQPDSAGRWMGGR
jgi:hypothetical protein